jgi:hypothetical protein
MADQSLSDVAGAVGSSLTVMDRGRQLGPSGDSPVELGHSGVSGEAPEGPHQIGKLEIDAAWAAELGGRLLQRGAAHFAADVAGDPSQDIGVHVP